LSRTAYAFQHEAIERRIEFVIEVAEEIHNWILDEDRIMQVLINLLANAFKYTPDEGKILMRATKENKELLVEVVDSVPVFPKKSFLFFSNAFIKPVKVEEMEAGWRFPSRKVSLKLTVEKYLPPIFQKVEAFLALLYLPYLKKSCYDH
jgi:hypothetical protein